MQVITYNAYWTPEKEREEREYEFYREERERQDAAMKCVEYLELLLTEIDSLCDWPDYRDMQCQVSRAQGQECEEDE